MPPIKFFLSHRADGTMQFVGGAEALGNRHRYLEKVGVGEERVVSGKLVSGNHIALVKDADAGQALAATDGLITTTKDLYLSITVADCIPVVIYSPGRVIALLHVGWRGLDNKIIPHALQQLADVGFTPSDLHAYLGPHICAKHYDIDLSQIAESQILASGLEKSNIIIDKTCTFESDDLFSHRRDQTSPTQAMLVLAAL